MTNLTKLRTIFYSLVIAFGVIETGLAGTSAWLNGFSELLPAFAKAAALFSLFTWIWTSFLLTYHNNSLQSHLLTKKVTHLLSFGAYTLIWFALGMLILSQTSTECNFNLYSDGLAGLWCGMAASSGTIGVLVAILCALTAIFVFISEADSQGNIRQSPATSDGENAAP